MTKVDMHQSIMVMYIHIKFHQIPLIGYLVMAPDGCDGRTDRIIPPPLARDNYQNLMNFHNINQSSTQCTSWKCSILFSLVTVKATNTLNHGCCTNILATCCQVVYSSKYREYHVFVF